jgi:hypothetical protein
LIFRKFRRPFIENQEIITNLIVSAIAYFKKTKARKIKLPKVKKNTITIYYLQNPKVPLKNKEICRAVSELRLRKNSGATIE